MQVYRKFLVYLQGSLIESNYINVSGRNAGTLKRSEKIKTQLFIDLMSYFWLNVHERFLIEKVSKKN